MATPTGPNYWGSTFFIWPPDPTNDWRKNFFFLPDGVTPVNDDTALWDNNGNWLQPPGQLRHQLQGDPELDREHRA